MKSIVPDLSEKIMACMLELSFNDPQKRGHLKTF